MTYLQSPFRESNLVATDKERIATGVDTFMPPPLNYGAGIALRASTFDIEHRTEALLSKQVIPELTTGFLSPMANAVAKFENIPMDVTAAFTVGYNASTFAQCAMSFLN